MRKIALVGIGKIAVDQHIPAIMKAPKWQLSATVSRQDTSNIAPLDGIEAYTDFDEMLTNRPDIEVISLAMPPKPRFDYAVRALNCGRHVMLEKPPASTLSQCKALADLARRNNVTLFASWHSRHAAKVQPAKAWLKNQELHQASVTWREDVQYWHPGQDWVFEAGGLGVFDPGINALSILTEIIDQPIHLQEAELVFPQNRQAPIAASAQFYYPLGAQISLELDWRAKGTPNWVIECITAQGTLKLTHGGAQLMINGKADDTGHTATDHSEYISLYDHMEKLIERKRSDTDFSPLRHVADAFMMGKRTQTTAFEWS